LSTILPLTDEEKHSIAEATKKKAYDIIKAKGFTSYGIGAVTSSICESIIFDLREVYPLSHFQEKLGCCLSLPAVLGRSGILSTVDLQLDEKERESVEASGKSLREVISKYDV
jgi:L-lactate dehydrogenase